MDRDFTSIMQSITQKSMALSQECVSNSKAPTLLIEQFIELSKDYQVLMQELLTSPEQLLNMQLNFWQQSMSMMNESMTQWLEGTPTESHDKRFSDDLWQKNPFFYALSQQYLHTTQHIQDLITSVEHQDAATEKKLKFFTQQYLDMLAPSNFLATNPVVLNETIKTGGKNILDGLDNLLSDLAAGNATLDIKMTDEKAFKLGGNLAITPGKVVFQNELMQLIQYLPSTDKAHKTPLLIIPPWINKYYILDLSEHNSLVKWAVSQGHTVFMISWVNPNSAHANKGLSDYLHLGPLAAIACIKQQLEVKKVNALGFCIGGTLLAITLAYLKAHKHSLIKSATLLTTLIDFSEPGDIAMFIDEKQVSLLEKEMTKKGYLSGKHMASTFNSLRANDLIWSFFIKNYLHGKKPMPFDILYWNGDSTNMPAKMHSEYLRKLYLQNQLFKQKLTVDDTRLNIRDIDTPCFFVSTEKDHIAPWQTSYNGFSQLSGPKTFLLGGSGHIAGIINPPSKNKYGYHTHEACDKSAMEWLDGASFHQGSWWPHWGTWLKKQAGAKISAPTPETGQFEIIEDAPGSYVKMPSE